MNAQRIIFAVVLAIQVALVELARQNIVPTWTPFFALGGSVLLAFTESIGKGGPPKPPSVVPTIAVLGVVVGLSVSACSLFTAKNVQTALDAVKVACILQNAFVDDATLDTMCGLVTAEQRLAARAIVSAERVRASKPGGCHDRKSLSLDGGADASADGAL